MYRIDNDLYFRHLIRSLTLTRAANPLQTPVTPQVRGQARSTGWGGFTGPEVRANANAQTLRALLSELEELTLRIGSQAEGWR